MTGAKNKGGRPPALEMSSDLLKQIKGAGSIRCTHREVAAVLGVAYQTWLNFKTEFPEAQEAYDMGLEAGKASLRRTQFKLAERNAAMAIWLGKQYLDQVDRREISGPGGGPIEHRDRPVSEDMSEKEAAEAYAASLRRHP